ncbi:hypothetical protein [Hansschlegelia plantiphila]|uniref:Transmembrane protein n=1 Tax=Hansschlegelia plantiphila TaxID=374655 RepID=A0A9W6MVV5_9HYPH|nr:hypothetical protein [Hansschlegelia plantiphila]GLK68185.1 hypothetical protein GCM10008179_18230 [Hansschlegelia plantiphila]
MLQNSVRTRVVAAAVLSAAVFGAALAPSAAQADRWHRNHYYGHHHGGGGTAAAIVGVGALGLLAGTAIANSNARRDDECRIERRRYVDQYGRSYLKRIEVCD